MGPRLKEWTILEAQWKQEGRENGSELIAQGQLHWTPRQVSHYREAMRLILQDSAKPSTTMNAESYSRRTGGLNEDEREV